MLIIEKVRRSHDVIVKLEQSKIEDVEKARQPYYTTGREGERCGMGFLVMESFCDSVNVKSRLGRGTTVLLRKKLKP